MAWIILIGWLSSYIVGSGKRGWFTSCAAPPAHPGTASYMPSSVSSTLVAMVGDAAAKAKPALFPPCCCCQSQAPLLPISTSQITLQITTKIITKNWIKINLTKYNRELDHSRFLNLKQSRLGWGTGALQPLHSRSKHQGDSCAHRGRWQEPLCAPSRN